MLTLDLRYRCQSQYDPIVFGTTKIENPLTLYAIKRKNQRIL